MDIYYKVNQYSVKTRLCPNEILININPYKRKRLHQIFRGIDNNIRITIQDVEITFFCYYDN